MAAYEFEVQTVLPRSLAVARGAASRAGLAETILELLDPVWTVLREQGLPFGHNVVVYPQGGLMNIDAGVEVFGPFQPSDQVQPSTTPAGEAAMTVHWGDYARLAEAHIAVGQWCQAHGRQPAGPTWEVYGDWEDDPQRRRTDVYVLLSPA